MSGIIHVIKRGLHWLDCPAEYGSAKTIYNRYARWSEKGVYRGIENSRGGRNSKVHAVTDDKGRPVVLVLTAAPKDR